MRRRAVPALLLLCLTLSWLSSAESNDGPPLWQRGRGGHPLPAASRRYSATTSHKPTVQRWEVGIPSVSCSSSKAGPQCSLSSMGCCPKNVSCCSLSGACCASAASCCHTLCCSAGAVCCYPRDRNYTYTGSVCCPPGTQCDDGVCVLSSNAYRISFAITLALIVCVLCSYCCCRYCSTGRRASAAAAVGLAGGAGYGTAAGSGRGLPDHYLAEIPLLPFDQLHQQSSTSSSSSSSSVADSDDREAGDAAPSCRICFEDFAAKDMVRLLPCSHVFHDECIDKWFGMRDTCPLCVQKIAELIDRGQQRTLASSSNSINVEPSETTPLL